MRNKQTRSEYTTGKTEHAGCTYPLLHTTLLPVMLRHGNQQLIASQSQALNRQQPPCIFMEKRPNDTKQNVNQSPAHLTSTFGHYSRGSLIFYLAFNLFCNHSRLSIMSQSSRRIKIFILSLTGPRLTNTLVMDGYSATLMELFTRNTQVPLTVQSPHIEQKHGACYQALYSSNISSHMFNNLSLT